MSLIIKNVNHLPASLIEYSQSFLSVQERAKCELVCKLWQKTAKSNQTWSFESSGTVFKLQKHIFMNIYEDELKSLGELSDNIQLNKQNINHIQVAERSEFLTSIAGLGVTTLVAFGYCNKIIPSRACKTLGGMASVGLAFFSLYSLGMLGVLLGEDNPASQFKESIIRMKQFREKLLSILNSPKLN